MRTFEIGQRVRWKCGGIFLFGRVKAVHEDTVEIVRAADVYFVERRKVRAVEED